MNPTTSGPLFRRCRAPPPPPASTGSASHLRAAATKSHKLLTSSCCRSKRSSSCSSSCWLADMSHPLKCTLILPVRSSYSFSRLTSTCRAVKTPCFARSCSIQRNKYVSRYFWGPGCSWYCLSTAAMASASSSSGGASAGIVSCHTMSSSFSAIWPGTWLELGECEVSLSASFLSRSRSLRLSPKDRACTRPSNLRNSCSKWFCDRLPASSSIMVKTLDLTTSKVPSASVAAHRMSRCSDRSSPDSLSTCRILRTSSAYCRWCRLALSIFRSTSLLSIQATFSCSDRPLSTSLMSLERSIKRWHSRAALSSLLKLEDRSISSTNTRCTSRTSASALINAPALVLGLPISCSFIRFFQTSNR
mmetsp:Transcript_9836/g.26666  ORF Transcript_9836/g.26666 Transcript_9836/m.26666 type:complete len:361 (-) Transcript_9836:31-1113(-)